MAEKQLGLPVTGEAIEQMEANLVRAHAGLPLCHVDKKGSCRSIWMRSNLRLLLLRKRRGATTLWRMSIPLAQSRLLPQASSSAQIFPLDARPNLLLRSLGATSCYVTECVYIRRAFEMSLKMFKQRRLDLHSRSPHAGHQQACRCYRQIV